MSEEFYKRPTDLHNVIGISSQYNGNDNFRFIKCINKVDYTNLITGDSIKLKNGKKYKSCNCFELITNKTPKLYFDIDYKEEISIEQFNKELQILNDILNEKLQLDSDKVAETKSFVLDSPLIYIREEEDQSIIKSAHIIYHKVCMKKTEQKQLTLYIQDYIQKIDTKVYGNNNLFCLPNNTKHKYNARRKFIPYNQYTRDNGVINNYLINETNGCEKLEYKTIYEEEVIKNGDFTSINIDKDTLVDKLIEVLPNEFYKDNFMWKCLLKYLYTENSNYYLFMEHSAKITNKECSNEIIANYITDFIKNWAFNPSFILHKIAKQYNVLLSYSPFTDNFIEYCINITRMNGLKQKLTEIHTNNTRTENKRITEIHYKHFIIKIYQEVILDTNKQTFYYYSQDHITDSSEYELKSKISNIEELKNQVCYIQNKLIIVKALWGSGKTKHIVLKMLKFYKKKKVLIVSENNSLNTELTNKLKKLGFNVINHQNKENKITEADIQICSLESINKIYHVDIIILDEYETICSHFSSTTLNQNANTDYTIFNKLKSLLLSSEKVLCLDADISLSRVEWIEKLLNVKSDKYYLTDNNFSEYEFNYYYSYNQFNTEFINELKHKKLVLCSSSKKQIQVIREQVNIKYPRKNILYICNDPIVRVNDIEYPKEEFIAELENNIQEHNIDLLLYTPTITTGVSIETEYFDKLYAVGFNYKCPNVRTFIQMFFRVRNLKQKQINITTLQSLNFNRYNNKSYEKYITIREQQLISNKYSSINNSNGDIDELYNELRINNAKEKSFSERAFIQDLYTRFKQHKITINNIYLNTKLSFFKEYREASEIVKEQKLLELQEVELIDYTGAENLKNQEAKTYEDQLKLTKYYILRKVSSVVKDIIINGSIDLQLQLYSILLENTDLIKSTNDLYKYEKLETEINEQLKHLTNTDTKQIELDTVMDILKMFNANKDFTAIYTNTALHKLIDDNKDTITGKFNEYQVILNIENKIDFTKSIDVYRDTKKFLKNLKDYGITTGYLKSKNKIYKDHKYNFEYNTVNTPYPNTKFYITLTLNDFIKNSIYQDTQDTDLIKITENGKEYKLHDYRNNKIENINKKLVKATKNRIRINNERPYQKSYDNELLYPSTYNKYSTTDVDTKVNVEPASPRTITVKLDFNAIYSKSCSINILTNRVLPVINPAKSNFNNVLNELTNINGIIKSHKKVVDKQLIYPRLNKYYKIKSIIFKDYYTILTDNLDEDYCVNYNITHFDYEAELLHQINPIENYKTKCSSVNDTEMYFDNKYFISMIEYVKLD
jgi:hypothetical protein